MESLPKVTVVGAGFSGLVSAYYLVEAGYPVEVFEASERVGGLIQTVPTGAGRIETAANGILSSKLVEDLCDAIGVKLVQAGRKGKKRYIFRDGKPRRWPLRFMETLRFIFCLFTVRGKPPLGEETVRDWTVRVLGLPAYQYLVTPALQGIYAGDPERLSAELIFGRFFGKKTKKAKSRYHGTVAPILGMGELTEKLRLYLVRKGVAFHFKTSPSLVPRRGPVVIATSLPSAVKLLVETYPRASQILGEVEMLPLASVNLSFRKDSPHLEGFGCVFARDEGIRSLGVLFEETIFGGRSDDHLERWILGGATDPDAVKLGDAELIAAILEDRHKLLGLKGERIAPLASHITRWSVALPHCTLSLRSALESREVKMLSEERGIFLLGNYTGKLGLSGILETASRLPERLSTKEAPI